MTLTVSRQGFETTNKVIEITGNKYSLISRTREAFREKLRIQVRTRHEVALVDPINQMVLAKDLNSFIERWERFDQLLFATGARPLRPPAEGIGGRNICYAHNLVSG